MRRRAFLKGCAAGALAAGAPFWQSCGGERSAQRRDRKPNVVLIVADDLGWNRVGYHGSTIETPNIDRIAREGVELDRFYASPVCVPSRAGIMTGRYPIRFGMQGHNPAKGAGLPKGEVTLAAHLARAGYVRRAIHGKWHLGSEDGVNHPLDVGFTHFYGNLSADIDYFTHQRNVQGTSVLDWHRQRDVVTEPGYATDLLGVEASRFIAESASADEAFFLYLPFQAIHAPLMAPERYADRYTDELPVMGLIARMVTCMDDAIGSVLGELDAQGLADDTIVVFTSDNGGTGGRNANHPLRGEKAHAYEGGIRVPAAARWPAGGWSGGRVVDALLAYIDLVPTLLDAVGAEPTALLDGIAAGALLEGRESGGEREIFTFVDEAEPPQMALNTPEWKLVFTGRDLAAGWPQPDGEFELFRIEGDPCEKRNRAQMEPDRTRRMAERMLAFLALRPE